MLTSGALHDGHAGGAAASPAQHNRDQVRVSLSGHWPLRYCESCFPWAHLATPQARVEAFRAYMVLSGCWGAGSSAASAGRSTSEKEKVPHKT